MTEHAQNFSDPQGSPCPDEQRRLATGATASTALAAVVDMPSKAERLVSHHDTIAVLDTARYEQMWRVATAIANSSFCPETLSHYGPKNSRQRLEPHQIIANCFLVVNQAVRWNMDPFALIQCASMVHGKPCYEGKVIAAVLDSLLGTKLDFEFEGTGEFMRVVVSGTRRDGKIKTVKGSVAQWKTTGENSPWRPADYERQLIYRGTREWARLWEPAVLLGVHAPDEMMAGVNIGDSEPIALTEKPTPPTTPPPRRLAAGPAPLAAAPPPQRSRPIPVKGKPDKPATTEEGSSEDEQSWLRCLEMDLRSCAAREKLLAAIDACEGARAKLSGAGKKRADEIINMALSEAQR